MSATTPDLSYQAGSGGRRIPRAGWTPAPWLRALLVSRLLVIGAGIAGTLVGRRPGWWMFDPSGLSAHLGAVGNVLGASAVRWDAIHYLAVARFGYTRAASTPFFPLYPLLVRLLGDVLGSGPAAGVLISVFAFGVALRLLHRLTTLELGPRVADATILLVAFAPLSFFFNAVYTESLFLALSVGSIYAARRGRWKLAAGLGGLAAATRVTGVVLALPLAVMYLRERRRLDPGLAWLAAVPAGLAGYLVYLAIRGYGFLAPFAQESGAEYGRQMGGPVHTFVAAVQAATLGLRSIASRPIYQPSVGGAFSPGAESILLVCVLALAIAALVGTFRRLPLAYGLYALAALLVCTWSPVAGQPLESFDRYALTIFPLWMAVAAWLSERRLTRATVLVSGALLAFWTFQFATWAFVA
jgi:Mannosyltransferase (PIG-V)